jgi:LemA protein
VTWVIVLVVVLLIVAVAAVVIYNRLVRLRNRAENAWAQVDVQLRRRYDLIPNLVEAVKGYAAHERGTFDEVTQARTAAQQAKGVAEQAEAENVLTAAIGRLFAVAEAYPQLRATENFQQLQAQLSDVEQNIAVSRQVYNDTVLSYDNALETFPTNVIAGWFHFNPREYFQTEDVTRAAPQVSFADTPAAPPAVPQPPPEAPASPSPPTQSG